MSRKKEIEKAAAFLGLYAAHDVCYGSGWREVGHYWGRASTILGEIRLNDKELEFCRLVALERAMKYIEKAYADPSKTGLPFNKEDAIRMAKESIDNALKDLQGR